MSEKNSLTHKGTKCQMKTMKTQTQKALEARL